MYESLREPRNSSPLRGCLVITAATILLVVGVSLFFDNRCYTQLRDNLLPYPNAQMVGDSHDFLSRTAVVYETSDSPTTVQAWYRQMLAMATRTVVEGGPVTRSDWADLYRILPLDDRGSRIIFAWVCGS
ncbi:MAG: hypothetical protein SF123_13790 [Chloroflexota bacterium]|nr:hypothetical protein [Chloroflexota bacterium]